MDDIVSGSTVVVTVPIEQTPPQVWDAVTDVTRIGEWSPECVGGQWVAPDDGPRVGARFLGHNRFPGGFEATVTCVVTDATRPHSFAWVVLDPSGDPARPGSIWRYELDASPDSTSTIVRHTFTHGPGDTGLRSNVDDDPAHGRETLDERREELRRNMVTTLEAMGRSFESPNHTESSSSCD